MTQRGLTPHARETLDDISDRHGNRRANRDPVGKVEQELWGGDWEPASEPGWTRNEILSELPEFNQGEAA